MTQHAPFPAQHADVFACFAARATQDPGAIAVIDESGETTYGALAARADAIARRLGELQLAPEAPVAVLMHRRAELLAVLLGVWKAGAAYVPIDPRDPPDRVRRMIASCAASVIVGDPPLLDPVRRAYETAGVDAPRCVDPASAPASSSDAAPRPSPASGERLAYLLFTSGSTGEPKAVEVEHRQVLALLHSAADWLGFGAGDRYLAASTIAFDASVTELFLPLVTGASLLLRDRSILLDPHGLARDVRRHGVTVLATGPSVWQVLLDEVDDFPRVRVAITHGEAVSPAVARRIAAQGETAWNLYGPTETTVWATGARLRVDDPPGPSAASAPIGRPLPHVRAYVVDAHGAAVADGVEGELWLGGPSVARGYRNNDALTRERFVALGGDRMYRTGDVVVRQGDGTLHYFGRNDDQIKVRGVRVEPGEVEAALLRDPRVAQAAATWFATRGGTRAIVAAVVLKPGSACLPQDLHQGLADRLPSTMIPSRFLFVPWLPMTTSGKVDRKALRREVETKALAEADPGPASEAPRPARLTHTERAIAGIWQRMLGVGTVAPDDHFFSIGGDSLTAVQMMVEVEEHFGLVVPGQLAFDAPTLAALARRIDEARERRHDELASGFVFPLVPAGQGAPLFFSGVDLVLARRGRWTVGCPLYAIANWAKGSGLAVADSMESLAAGHVAHIKRLQPHGPYRLAGYSLGGLVAFEIAQQLRAAGEEVALLFLLDAMSPDATTRPEPVAPPRRSSRASLPRRLARHVRQTLRGPGDAGWGAWARQMILYDMWPVQLTGLVDWYHYVAVNHFLRHPNPVSRALFPRDRWRAFWFAARRMVKGYRARPYAGRTLAVFCEGSPRSEGWSRYLPADTPRLTLKARHRELFESPALDEWMTWMSARLDSETGASDARPAASTAPAPDARAGVLET